MKLRSLLCSLFAAALLSGCTSLPQVAARHWTHDGNYGPVTTHYEAQNIEPQADGSLVVESYSGHVKVLGGYGVTDTVEGLHYTPAPKKETIQTAKP